MRCLDHHQPKDRTRDKAVAAREILGARLPGERHFRDNGAALGDFLAQAGIFRRVRQVETASQDADRAGRQAALMRRRVDAARKAGDDCVAVAAEVGRQHACHLDAGQGRVACPNDGDTRQPKNSCVALYRQQRRRMVHVAQ